MDVSIYSREQIEMLITDGNFPGNTAVISFYDPAIKHIDKEYSHVDYSKVCDTVFYSEVEDLDRDYLPDKGYTYEDFFLEADELAAFIVRAFMDGKDIICQCEYGQSRSAGCAAAILEYFYGNGISVFVHYDYYPNQVIFHKVYDALVRINPMYRNTFAFKPMQHIPQLKTDFSTGVTTLYSKKLIEGVLSRRGNYYTSIEDAYAELRHGKAWVYVSCRVDGVRVCDGPSQGEHNIGVKAFVRYHEKDVAVWIIMPEFQKYAMKGDYYLGKYNSRISHYRRSYTLSFDLLGVLEMGYYGSTPIIQNALITNIVPKEDSN